jgi:NADPH:quinone reductase
MVKIRQSTIIDAPIDHVWSILRDFNGHDRWHPAIASSEIEGGEPVDAIGSVRDFKLGDGSRLREQLLALSDDQTTLTYCLLEAPLPLMGYVATIRLKPVTDGERTYWEWHCEFNPPPERREELTRLVSEQIYRAGFAAIRQRLARGTPVARVEAPLSRTDNRAPTGSASARAPSQGAVSAATANGASTRAIVVEEHGGPEVMRMRDIALPDPGPGEVQIRHTVIGVNFIDVYCRTGYFDLLKPPGVPGMEAAGIIEAVGSDVSDYRVGDRVAYACPPVGAYAERRNMAPDLLVHLSDDISDETAASSLLKGVAASFLLHEVYPVKAGDTVLVHAAAGGIGQFLVQWAKHLGATVIATVSTDDKARVATARGADHVVVYSRDSFAEAVMRLTGGRGANVVYDAVGKDTFADSLAALAVRGHLVSFGQASGPVGDWDIGRFASKSVTVSRPNYGHFTDTSEKLAIHVDRFFGALRQGVVSIDPPTRYRLDEAQQAHRDLEARRTTGALVLTV